MASSWRLSPDRFVAYPAPEQDHGFDETPHNPASRLQKYRLTEKGRRLLAQLEKGRRPPDLMTNLFPFETDLWTAAGKLRAHSKRVGLPPKGNANFAWVQHFIHHLAPQGMAGFVLANGSMSSNQSGEGEIRKALIEADLEMPSDELRTTNRVAPTSTFEIHPSNFASLPGQLFYSTQIPDCLWFCGKNNTLDSAKDARLFDGETELSLVA